MHEATAPRPRVPLLIQLLVALVAGVIVGRSLGPRAALLGEAAALFVKLLKVLAMPLVFFAIVDTLVTTRVPLKRALVLFPLSTLNAAVAVLIALGLGRALPLGRFVDLASLRAMLARKPPPSRLDAVKWLLEKLTVQNLLWVIGAALVVGVALCLAQPRPAARVVAGFSRRALALTMRALALVVQMVPLAAFGVLAMVVGTSGFSIFPVLGLFVIIVTLGIALHVFGWYSLLLALLARRAPVRFFRLGGDALATAMATGSSLATLPVTLRTLSTRLGVSEPSARLAAVVGTNLNHDGIVLYEAAAAMFVAQLYDVHLSLAQQLTLVGQAVVAAIGIAGVPEAGFVTLAAVLGRTGLPQSAAALLMPVDWLLGRLRATCNVASDMVVATLLDRFSDGS